MGRGRPARYWDAATLRARERPAVRQRRFRAAPGLSATPDRDGACIRAGTDRQRALPYTLAIHAGRDGDGEEHNPHAHLMISERQNDGIERARAEWFRRANRASGARRRAEEPHLSWPRVGGARARTVGGADNAKLGSGARRTVDHRSYERQGIDREPGSTTAPRRAHGRQRRSTTASRVPSPIALSATTPSERLTTRSASSRAATTAAAEAPWDMKAIDHDNNATGPRPDATTTCLPGGSHAKCHRYVSGAARGC